MMSLCRNTNSGTRMCSMLLSEPVSRLSMQMTRCPRRSNSSHRCEPRNPAPPVTRQVAMRPPRVLRTRANRRSGRLRSGPRGLQLLLLDVRRDPVDAQVDALGQALLLEAPADDG